jgi:hypothetical protein
LEIYIGGEGGHYADRMRRCKPPWEPEEILIETLDRGMQSGAPSVAIIMLNYVTREALVGQTSARLFLLAAEAIKAKYGDLVGALVVSADLASGTAELTVSAETMCSHCQKRIPGSFRYCSNCGTKL